VVNAGNVIVVYPNSFPMPPVIPPVIPPSRGMLDPGAPPEFLQL